MKSGNVVVALLGAIFRVVVAILAVYVIYQGALICYDYGYRILRNRHCPPVKEGL